MSDIYQNITNAFVEEDYEQAFILLEEITSNAQVYDEQDMPHSIKKMRTVFYMQTTEVIDGKVVPDGFMLMPMTSIIMMAPDYIKALFDLGAYRGVKRVSKPYFDIYTQNGRYFDLIDTFLGHDLFASENRVLLAEDPVTGLEVDYIHLGTIFGFLNVLRVNLKLEAKTNETTLLKTLLNYENILFKLLDKSFSVDNDWMKLCFQLCPAEQALRLVSRKLDSITGEGNIGFLLFLLQEKKLSAQLKNKLFALTFRHRNLTKNHLLKILLAANDTRKRKEDIGRRIALLYSLSDSNLDSRTFSDLIKLYYVHAGEEALIRRLDIYCAKETAKGQKAPYSSVSMALNTCGLPELSLRYLKLASPADRDRYYYLRMVQSCRRMELYPQMLDCAKKALTLAKKEENARVKSYHQRVVAIAYAYNDQHAQAVKSHQLSGGGFSKYPEESNRLLASYFAAGKYADYIRLFDTWVKNRGIFVNTELYEMYLESILNTNLS